MARIFQQIQRCRHSRKSAWYLCSSERDLSKKNLSIQGRRPSKWILFKYLGAELLSLCPSAAGCINPRHHPSLDQHKRLNRRNNVNPIIQGDISSTLGAAARREIALREHFDSIDWKMIHIQHNFLLRHRSTPEKRNRRRPWECVFGSRRQKYRCRVRRRCCRPQDATQNNSLALLFRTRTGTAPCYEAYGALLINILTLDKWNFAAKVRLLRLALRLPQIDKIICI